MIDFSEFQAKREAAEQRKSKRADNRDFIAKTSGNTAKKAKRRKSLSNSHLEALRWEAFAAVIRERDAAAGCFSCDGGSAESAGHVISRRKLATKYDERNVLGQCLKCNWADKFLPGFHDRCVSLFIRKTSEATYHELVAQSNRTLQESRQDKMESAWGYVQRMSEGPHKEKIRKKLARFVPVEYGGELA